MTHNESNVGFPRFYSFLAVMMIEEACQTPSSWGFCTIHVLHHASSLMQSVGVNVFSLLKQNGLDVLYLSQILRSWAATYLCCCHDDLGLEEAS